LAESTSRLLGTRQTDRTHASNVVPHDTNNSGDIFIADRRRHTIGWISVSSSGRQASVDSFSPGISADGRFVAFASNASNLVPGDTNRNRRVRPRSSPLAA